MWKKRKDKANNISKGLQTVFSTRMFSWNVEKKKCSSVSHSKDICSCYRLSSVIVCSMQCGSALDSCWLQFSRDSCFPAFLPYQTHCPLLSSLPQVSHPQLQSKKICCGNDRKLQSLWLGKDVAGLNHKTYKNYSCFLRNSL